MRILVVEDEPMLADCIKNGLQEQGYRVDLVRDGFEGQYLAIEGDYALVLLDTKLAGTDLRVLQAIRRTKNVPVLMLTARDKLSDRLQGLKLGADDYLAMPFSVPALLVRVQALLERGRPLEPTHLRLADLEVDLKSRKCARSGVLLKLSPTEFSLLAVLLQRRGAVLSRATLAQQVWNTDLASESTTLEVTIGRLRRKLDDPCDLKLLHTVRGAGYVLEDRTASSGPLAVF